MRNLRMLAQHGGQFGDDRHAGFVIAADECYSEIYFREGPDAAPLGGLEAAQKLGRTDFHNLISLTSLSKRSNVPGMRSGFVAGDAKLMKSFLLYRTYHGSAMGPAIQRASIAAWSDEAHVVENRAQYRLKFERVTPILASVMDVALPDAGFYLWAGVPDKCGNGSDEWFAKELLAQYNVAVLPGSYLAREAKGVNPGQGRIRMALVAGVDDKGPAKPAGIEPGDVVIKFDGRDIKEPKDLSRTVADTAVGAPGTVAGTNDPDAAEGAPSPSALVATRVHV